MTEFRLDQAIVGGAFLFAALVVAWRSLRKRDPTLLLIVATWVALSALTLYLPPFDHIINNGAVTPKPLAILQWIVASGFFVIGAVTMTDWLRHRGRSRLMLGISMGLLGCDSLFAQVWLRISTDIEPLLPNLMLLLFSGYFFFLFRTTLIPARRSTLAIISTATVLALCVGLLIPGPTTRSAPVHYSPAAVLASLFVIGTWMYCIGEPCFRLWRHSKGLPVVQRMRARYLAAGYGGIILILLIAVPLVLAFQELETSDIFTYGLELVVLGALPLMYFSIVPPAWMRRFWRETEEEAFRMAIHSLLVGEPDATALGMQCLGWAVRLVGAEAGCIVGLDGTLLATNNLTREQALMLAGASHHEEGRQALRLSPEASPSNVIVVPMQSSLGSGAICVVAGRFTPLLGSDEVNRLTQYAASVTAAFDRFMLLSQVREARDIADRASRRKSDYLSRMSHELRTPMSAILGFADLLSLNEPRSDQKEDIDAIIKAADHLLALINEVLEISLIEAGTTSLSLEPVDLNHVVEESFSLVGRRAAMQNIRLEKHLHADHTFVVGDNQRLRQVMVNLLSNAVKYNRVDGEVVVTTTEIDGHIRVEVSDTGLGIDPESMDRLFEPFQRMGKEATKIEGTGLGLALSKALVEAMHGTMGVNTKLGEGSTFWFEVDRTEEATAAPGEGATVSEMRHPDRRAEYHDILYVEDNLANVELADRVLSQERPNLNLVAVSSGVQALEYLEDHHPGLVILDVHLGDINGDEILRHIRATSRLQDLPVIMLSADASKSQIERLLSMGANEYLTKPFRVKTFLHAVDDGLQGTLHSSRMADASA